MPLFLNIVLRIIVCIGISYAAQLYIPHLTPSGMFNVFQFSFLVVLCVVPLSWPSLLLIEDLTNKKTALAAGIKTKPVHAGNGHVTWPEVETAANGLALAEAIQETPIAKYTTYTFVSGYASKKATKLQETLNKGLIPAALVSAGALLTAIVAQHLANQAKFSLEATEILTGVVQAYASSISFFWTIGCLYGEVDLARDVARST